MKLVYVAGPYSDPRGFWYSKQNIQKAEEIAVELWQYGFAVICPHANTAFFDGAIPYDQFLAGDFEIIRRCDVLVLLPGWEKSKGALKELEHAKICNVKYFEWPRDKKKLEKLANEC